MTTATLIVYPAATAACTGVNAISIGAHIIRVELNTPSLHTVRFARSKFQGPLPDADGCALADACRVVAYRHGVPAKRNLTK